jgi:hypothetical protein
MKTETLQRFRVHLRSAGGMWEQYSGYVDVCAEDADEAFPRAVRELTRTSFPDRPSLDSWVLKSVAEL